MKTPGRHETSVHQRTDSIEEEENLDDFLIDIEDKQEMTDLNASNGRPSSSIGGKSVVIMMESPLTPNLADTETSDGSNGTLSPISPSGHTMRETKFIDGETKFLGDIEEEQGSLRLMDLTDTPNSPAAIPDTETTHKQREEEIKDVLKSGQVVKPRKLPEIRRRSNKQSNSSSTTSTQISKTPKTRETPKTPKTPKSPKNPKTPSPGETPPETPSSSKFPNGDGDNNFIITIKDKRFLTAEAAKSFMRDLDLPEVSDKDAARQKTTDKANAGEEGSSSTLENEEDPEAITVVKTPTPPPAIGLSKLIDTFELNGFLTPGDVKVFMEDLELPLFTDRVLQRKMRAVGASPRGFEDLNDFFAFVQNECQDVEKNPRDSFRAFDEKNNGSIEEFQLKRIFREMGDPMHDDDVDSSMAIAELYKDGAINFGKVLKDFEKQYDPAKEGENSRNSDKIKFIKSCWI